MNAIFPMVSFGGLPVEITMLLLGILIGFAQLFWAASAMTAERGTPWNIGPRDEAMPALGKRAGRLGISWRPSPISRRRSWRR